MSNVNDVLNARNSQYGDFMDDAQLAQTLKKLLQCHKDGYPWDNLNWDQAQALDMICTKIARIINGNPDNIDSWFDICGYAQLVVNRLEEDKNNPPVELAILFE